MAYTNSSLVTYKNITNNRTSPRNHIIDTITIHCIVGQWTAKQGCDYFATTDRECSANYIVGFDGSIGLSVEEKDRAWTSGNAENDHRAITIEVASDTYHPYAVTDIALETLIELVADICKRNDIKELKWQGDKSLIGQVDKQNMTVHRWLQNTACPGDYLYNLHGTIAERVNVILNADDSGWVQDGGKWRYRNTDGSYSKNKWQLIDGKWYYFDTFGYMKTGWVLYKDVWYYLQNNGAMLANDWAKDSNGWYYMDADGKPTVGWKKIDGSWYFFEKDGLMLTDDWAKDSVGWYYMGNDGKPVTNWLQIGEKWYYFNSDGLMQTGLQKIDGKLYYFAEGNDGHMCRTDEDGALV